MAENNPPSQDLKELLYRIADQEDFDLSAIDEATQKLNSLKISKMASAATASSSSESSGRSSPVVPELFRCPISGELMVDPVLLTTGQTFDRPCIETSFRKGQYTCPRTMEVLSDLTLTPNRLLRSMIVQWCLDNGLELPKLTYEEPIPNNATASYLNELLNKLLSSSLSDQKLAAKDLREITRTDHEFRALFARLPESIERLLYPISVHRHPDLQEDLITTVLNISIHDENKKNVAENPFALPMLIQSLQLGSIETQANAAAAIFSLCFHEANKILIGNAGALKPLIELVDAGHSVVIRDAAAAILKLCTATENKEKAVCSGAVSSILRKITAGTFVDEFVPILDLLSNHRKAIDEMCKLNTVSCMLRIMRKTASQSIKEKCISILYLICTNDRSKLKEIREDENENGTILELAQIGKSRAKRKAIGILEWLQKTAPISNTA